MLCCKCHESADGCSDEGLCPDCYLESRQPSQATPVQKPPCSACGGAGWLLVNNCDHGLQIERCDLCEAFDSDAAAVEAVALTAQPRSELLRFVEQIAGLQHEHEPDDGGEFFDRPSEDFVATLNELILEARQILGTADKCDECGEIVPYVIGTPDGAVVCQDCFDEGQH